MCLPAIPLAVMAASAAASAGGAIMSSNAQSSNEANAIRAKNDATTASIAKTNQDSTNAEQVFNSALKPYQTQSPTQQAQPAQAGDTSALQANTPGSQSLASGAITANAPQVVQNAASSDIASRLAKIGTSNSALGDLSGFTTANQNAGRSLADTASQVGTFDNFAKGDAAAGAAATSAAVANSQKAVSPFGDILQGVGSIGAQAAGGGWLNGGINPVNITPGNYGSLFKQGYLLPSG